MNLTESLRHSAGPLWERVVAHPFVVELGDGTLPPDVFHVYFCQDYLFLKDWVSLMCSGVIRSPDFDSARPLAAFINLALGAEEGLFQRYFRDRGMSRQDVTALVHLPTGLAYTSFLRRIAAEGSFVEVITTLLAIEWPYLEWGKRLAAAGKRPPNVHYQAWIDVHAGKELDSFVSWMRGVLDSAVGADLSRLAELYRATLRYELMFWEMAYRGESWPG